MKNKPRDSKGKILRKGDTIKLLNISLELFLGSDEVGQKALRGEIGSTHLIQDFSEYGKLKLEIHDMNNMPRTILISPLSVIRIIS